MSEQPAIAASGASETLDTASMLRALETSNIGTAVSDTVGAIIWTNSAFCTFLRRTADEVMAATWQELTYPDDVQVEFALISELRSGDRESYRLDKQFRLRDGSSAFGGLSVSCLRDEAGDITGFMGQVVELPESVAMEVASARTAANEEFRMMLENSADVVFHSKDGILRWVSPSSSNVLGIAPAELIGNATVQYWHPDDRADALQLREAVYAGRTGHGTLRWRRPDGSYVWVDAVVRPLSEQDGTFGMVGSLRDTSERVEAQRALALVMGHDLLTGLITRTGMIEQLAVMLPKLFGQHLNVAILCVGIDRLSTVNDAYGHAAGDLALVTLARRIVEMVGEAGHVSRGSGVDFLVLATAHAENVNEVAALAERIRVAIREEVAVDHQHVQITASIGVSIAQASTDPEAVVQSATIAMEHAKEIGRDRVVFSAPELAAKAAHRAAMLERAREGLAQGEFVPVYAPIVELSTNRLCGYEALARWRRADGSVWEPAAFIQAMQSTPLICDLDLVMVRDALLALKHSPASMFMSVNVSVRTLSSPGYREALLDEVATMTKLRGPLHFEIPEAAIVTATPDVIASMMQLADAGVCWYVDTFGIGYSSLTHLRELPISGLKLDTSFTQGVGRDDETSVRVAQAIAGMARGLNLDTVVEGVDDARQAAALSAQGWHLGEGWLYGSPITMFKGSQ